MTTLQIFNLFIAAKVSGLILTMLLIIWYDVFFGEEDYGFEFRDRMDGRDVESGYRVLKNK